MVATILFPRNSLLQIGCQQGISPLQFACVEKEMSFHFPWDQLNRLPIHHLAYGGVDTILDVGGGSHGVAIAHNLLQNMDQPFRIIEPIAEEIGHSRIFGKYIGVDIDELQPFGQRCGSAGLFLVAFKYPVDLFQIIHNVRTGLAVEHRIG